MGLMEDFNSTRPSKLQLEERTKKNETLMWKLLMSFWKRSFWHLNEKKKENFSDRRESWEKFKANIYFQSIICNRLLINIIFLLRSA